MRKLRQLSMAVVLTFMLSTYALAGTIDTPPAPGTIDTPPAPQASGIIDTPPSATEGPTDPVLDIALDLLLSALMLF